MRRLTTATVALSVTFLAAVGAGTAQAGPGNSAAAHLCLHGPQIVEYVVDGRPGVEADADFGALPHGVGSTDDAPDVRGAWVEMNGHGQCASFVAKARKGAKTKDRPTVSSFVIVKTIDKSSPL